MALPLAGPFAASLQSLPIDLPGSVTALLALENGEIVVGTSDGLLLHIEARPDGTCTAT